MIASSRDHRRTTLFICFADSLVQFVIMKCVLLSSSRNKLVSRVSKYYIKWGCKNFKKYVQKHYVLNLKIPVIHLWLCQNFQLRAEGKRNLLFGKSHHAVNKDTFSNPSKLIICYHNFMTASVV
jgi:hypothetical protein